LFDLVYYEERASKQSKQASEDRDLDAKAKLPASATDGRKWTFGGEEEEEEEDAADGREPPRRKL
jgi:hypothetical protein